MSEKTPQDLCRGKVNDDTGKESFSNLEERSQKLKKYLKGVYISPINASPIKQPVTLHKQKNISFFGSTFVSS